MEPFVLRADPDAVVGNQAGRLTGDVLVALIETHSPEDVRRFAEGSLGAILAVLPLIVGDAETIRIFEEALAVLRARMATAPQASGVVQ